MEWVFRRAEHYVNYFGNFLAFPRLGHNGFPGRIVRDHFQTRNAGGSRFHRVIPNPPINPPEEYPWDEVKSYAEDPYIRGLGAHMFDFRYDDYLVDLPDEPTTSRTLIGERPRMVWTADCMEDIDRMDQANFWGRFCYPDDFPFAYKSKARFVNDEYVVDPFGCWDLSIKDPQLSVTQEVDLDLDDIYLFGYWVETSSDYGFSYQTYPWDWEDAYAYEKDDDIILKKEVDSEESFAYLEDDETGCCDIQWNWIWNIPMWIAHKFQIFEPIAIWFRMQLGISILKIMQSFFILFWCYLLGSQCEETTYYLKEGEKYEFPCVYIKVKKGHLKPFFWAYFAFRIPLIYPFKNLVNIMYWYQSCRWFHTILFIIHTVSVTHITAVIYISVHSGFKWYILFYHYSNILTHLFFIAYFVIQYDLDLENQIYWAWFMGYKERHKAKRWYSFYNGASDVRAMAQLSGNMMPHRYQYEYLVWWWFSYRTKHRILQNTILYYMMLNATWFKWIGSASLVLSTYVGTFICNFAVCSAESVYHLYYMHHVMMLNEFNRYEAADIFMMAVLT